MNWSYIYDIVKQHKSTLIVANLIAIMSALLSVPVTTVSMRYCISAIVVEIL